MSGPDRDQLRQRDQRRDAEVDAFPRAGAEPTELTARPPSSTAPGKIDAILKGHGPMRDLPELCAVLGSEQMAALRDRRLDDLSQAPGDIALECARLLEVEVAKAVRVGLDGRPPVSAKLLRAFLAQRTSKELATITGDTFTRLRGTLGGALIDAIPSIISRGLDDLAEHAGFLRWFVETTPPGVCAHVMSTAMSLSMGATLDRDRLWSWVEYLSPVDITDRIIGVTPYVKDPHARGKLSALVGRRAGASDDALAAHHAAHAGDLRQALAGKPTVRELLEAIGRAGGVDGRDVEPLIDALRRLNVSADDVLVVTSIAPIDRGRGLRMLLAAPGVTAQHLTAFLGETASGIELLADDRVRKEVRGHARGLRVQDLLPLAEADAFHATIFHSAGLTSWFLDEASPRDLLWFCTASPVAAARATRTVGQRRGFGWVHDLTSLPTGADVSLRVLAHHCHDARAERYLRDVLLGDVRSEDRVSIQGSLPTDPDTRQGEGVRLVEALDGSGAELLARLGDLDEGMRAKLGQNDEIARSIGARLEPEQWPRAARYLDLAFHRAVAGSPGWSSAIVAYLHERPHAEELAALGRPELVRRAAAEVHPDLLVVFRALNDPKHLAAAIGRDPGLLELLVAGSEPNRVAELIAREPVRPRAQAILEAQPRLVEKLPRYKHMTARGRAAIDRLGDAAPEDGEARAALDDVRSGAVQIEARAKSQGARFHRIEETAGTLAEAIEALAGSHAKARERLDRPSASATERREERRAFEVTALGLLEAHRREVPALLADRTLRPIVDQLSALVDLPPDAAIPWIGIAELVRLPNALRWWMTFRDPAALLHHLEARAEARALVAGAVSSHAMGALDWLQRVPKGVALDAAEERTLDLMRPLVRDAAALRALFEARFGIPAPPEYDARTLGTLYGIVSRLPPGHIQQERITAIVQQDLGKSATGMYGQGTGVIYIDDGLRPGSGQDTFYPEHMQGWYTAEQVQELYGFDRAALEAQLRAGRVETKVEGDVIRYRLVQQQIDAFTQVVLHEIGHAVDEVLGQRTPPVFDFADWREYSDATFDAWAAEMGGWGRVAPADRARIREVWLDAARGKTSVRALVGPDHPALAARYAGVGIVKSAIDGRSMQYTERVQHGDRVFVAGVYPGSWYSLRANAARSAPSVYALHAPAEYFAESYVEYYRGVDGTPGSTRQKGGALPAVVKQWFDENVDTIRFDPRRFQGGAADRGEGRPGQAAAAAKIEG